MAHAQEEAKPMEEPHGMEEEAQLLSEFAEVPGISAAWVRPGNQQSNQITVRSASTSSAACSFAFNEPFNNGSAVQQIMVEISLACYH